ncbi:tripartite tricarboxylate transporter substrate-binding protein [Sedimentitalea sp. JM2-8]|uniref:Tripartite tricarboxylate transporter substrate-binding protein n=1 Tax=Sedimentitalea xiamensis TaxID=3050037 RepID=A0ABT7FGK1_9RHOB|nr:tripartite tricarboxylate transporter substrate-binding protein [Sedimentitalea xiamensis]MDK3073904.1 tripartite tricarboxylate transporter substrate-binding protein [Sedimentitalea xiamensis]
MIFKFLKATGIAAAIAVTAPAQAEMGWTPPGPVNLLIPFGAGGSADSMARFLATGLNEQYGWEILPENIPGQGGRLMASSLAKLPADGTAIALAPLGELIYTELVTRDPGYSVADMTMITTLAGTQMGLIARADRGWNDLGDVIETARSGEKLSVAVPTQKLADATYLISREHDVDLTVVVTRGGQAAMSAVIAGDADLAWAGGLQGGNVLNGQLVNLVSGEMDRLEVSPDAPLLSKYAIPYFFGTDFVILAPEGLPDDARAALAEAIGAIASDEDGNLHKLLIKSFAGARLITGKELDDRRDAAIANDLGLLSDVDS